MTPKSLNAKEWMPECPLSALQKRAFLYQQIRLFFAEKGVLEVETPVLSVFANTDIQIEVFETQSIKFEDGKSYLRTSPEFFHKRLLAAGSGDIYEIAKVFRLGEQSGRHNPEFTMLEWYRLDFTLMDLMAEVSALVLALFSAFDLPILPVRYCSFEDLFEHHLNCQVFKISLDDLNSLCRAHGLYGDDLERDAALDFLFGVVIEPSLPAGELLFVQYFPVTQAALAQVNPDDANTCLRFELLWQGVELANGYQELTDAKELARRFDADNEWRLHHNKSVRPVDQYLLAAMQAGLPHCSGVAMGLDRLLMHLVKESSLCDVLSFPAGRA